MYLYFMSNIAEKGKYLSEVSVINRNQNETFFHIEKVNSANSGDVDICNLTVTLIRTAVLQRSW